VGGLANTHTHILTQWLWPSLPYGPHFSVSISVSINLRILPL
jgi:hypothetical protein